MILSFPEQHHGIADSVIRLFEKLDIIKGLKMVYEPEYLRFFQARFEELSL